MAEHNETDWVPTAKQQKFAELLLDPEDRRTRRAKINEVGVAPSTAYRWLKDRDFLDYLNTQIDIVTDGHLSTAWNSLINQVKRGETQAIKLFFELKGKYKQQHEHKHEGNLTHTLDLSYLSDEELEEELKKYEEEDE
ncbi:phBC6A51 family helix-turn-helix protein [Orenia marismortui]|uniref:phBC6A51 family helix-turn-helix protein n=1 Tax=Orenia marismortui TaxID=46469 RepID=UPI00036D3A32|nr:phBC6A51 family helix-turn-helix protein [Orenia marismortui]